MFNKIKECLLTYKELFKKSDTIFEGFSKWVIIYSIVMTLYYIGSDVLVSEFAHSKHIEFFIHFSAILGATAWIIWLYLIIAFLKHYTTINHKKNKDELKFKLTSMIAANIDHQLRSPLVAVRETFKDLRIFINEIIKIADPDGSREIDKIIYGCKDKGTHCKQCRLRSQCHSFPFISSMIEDTKEISHSLQQMEDTLELLKGNRDSKIIGDTDLFTIVNNAIMVYRMLYKQNINFKIDEKLKEYFIPEKIVPEVINIFNNHISNSIDAHAYFVVFGVVSYDPISEMLVLHIVDDGDGIPEDLKTAIWQYSISSKGEGRGFGMYFCRELLRSMGGDEKIYKTSSDGTVIEVNIPVSVKRRKNESES